MKNALFHNYSSTPFVGYWDGKPKTFKPGDKLWMPEYLARHYAKHLANRELIRAGKETATSPKKPDEVPEFMAEFDKAFTPEDGPEQGEAEAQMDLANRPQAPAEAPPAPKGEPQMIPPVPGDEDDEFEGLKESK